MVQLLHVGSQKKGDNATSYDINTAEIKLMLDVVLLNPYNAFRYIDCIQFLLLNNVSQR